MRKILSVSLAVLLSATACAESELAQRQSEVAEIGSAVMPFDLERSTHVFERTPSGGVQTVSSDDGDEAQIRLIRSHLAEEAGRFASGDFHDPEMIHGEDMPGLPTLDHLLRRGGWW